MFDEPFSLLQIYVPLNAYYLEDDPEKDFTEETRRLGRRRRRTVVDLEKELSDWIDNPKQEDAIRVISGGPGCGKSCFARVFAARQASKGRVKVLFIPLHLIDPTRDIEDEVARFVRDEGILQQNPLDPESPEPDLLLIFDGLDELASLGKAAAETARAFIREVERTVDKRNSNTVRLRVLISGRELIVQENESEFRRTRQILNILPYYVAEEDDSRRRTLRPEEQFHDPDGLLKEDLRQKWWTNYGQVTGRAFESLPKELSRVDLEEITAQPLLNYLVALSYTRGKLDFGKDVNLNAVYEDLVAAVHERAYEKKRRFAPIRHMKLDEFVRVLEEVGLAAWHGDGRTTTVREIEEHCRASGVGTLLDKFTEGAEAGVTRPSRGILLSAIRTARQWRPDLCFHPQELWRVSRRTAGWSGRSRGSRERYSADVMTPTVVGVNVKLWYTGRSFAARPRSRNISTDSFWTRCAYAISAPQRDMQRSIRSTSRTSSTTACAAECRWNNFNYRASVSPVSRRATARKPCWSL